MGPKKNRINFTAFQGREIKLPRAILTKSNRGGTGINDNEALLIERMKLAPGFRYDYILGANFVFGDFIASLLRIKELKTDHCMIATLGMSQKNVESLFELMAEGYINRLSLHVSVFFYRTEKFGLINTIYNKLGEFGERFSLSVSSTHAKIIALEANELSIVCHGSANLRSNGNIEQITIEDNKQLYDFYIGIYGDIERVYGYVGHKLKTTETWDAIADKNFDEF